MNNLTKSIIKAMLDEETILYGESKVEEFCNYIKYCRGCSTNKMRELFWTWLCWC